MNLSYQTSGSGIPLLLLHAFPLSSEMWSRQIRSLNGVRIIAPDLPGFGGSNLQKTPSIQEMASSVAKLLDSLDVHEPVVVAGLSMGGYVSFEFFRGFPKRVKALCLLSTKASPDTPEAREKRLKTIEAIEKEGLDSFAEKTLTALLGKTTLKSNETIVHEVKRLILSNKKEGVISALRALAGRRDSSDLLDQIKCPTLIVAGDEDVVIPVSEAEQMKKKIQGSKLLIISRAGHLINLEQPQVFDEILSPFLLQI